MNIWDEAEVTTKNWEELSSVGFCYDVDCCEEEFEGDDHSKIVQATNILNNNLTNHFELNFSEEIVCAPVVYGGVCEDGWIVGILSMRVWT